MKDDLKRVKTCMFSLDGKRILSIHQENILAVWDASTGLKVATLKGPFDRPSPILSFNSNLDRFLTSCLHNMIRIYAKTGEAVDTELFSPDFPGVIETERFELNSLEDLENRLRRALPNFCLAACTDQIESTGNGAKDLLGQITDKIKRIAGHEIEGLPRELVILDAGDRMITLCKSTALKLWDGRTGRELLSLERERERITACALSPDGKMIISGDSDGWIRSWDAENGKELAILKGRQDNDDANDPIEEMCDDQDARCPLNRIEGSSTCAHAKGITAIVFRADGKRLASASRDGTLKVWDADLKRAELILSGHAPSPVIWCMISADGRHIVSTDMNHVMKAWDEKTGNEKASIEFKEQPLDVRLLPDTGQLTFWDQKGSLQILEVETGKLLKEFPDCIALSPDGKKALVGERNGAISLLNVNSLEKELRFPHLDKSVFSPDGKYIFGTDLKSYSLWDAVTGSRIAHLGGFGSMCTTCVFSLDGKKVVVGCSDGTISIISIENTNSPM